MRVDCEAKDKKTASPARIMVVVLIVLIASALGCGCTRYSDTTADAAAARIAESARGASARVAAEMGDVSFIGEDTSSPGRTRLYYVTNQIRPLEIAYTLAALTRELLGSPEEVTTNRVEVLLFARQLGQTVEVSLEPADVARLDWDLLEKVAQSPREYWMLFDAASSYSLGDTAMWKTVLAHSALESDGSDYPRAKDLSCAKYDDVALREMASGISVSWTPTQQEEVRAVFGGPSNRRTVDITIFTNGGLEGAECLLRTTAIGKRIVPLLMLDASVGAVQILIAEPQGRLLTLSYDRTAASTARWETMTNGGAAEGSEFFESASRYFWYRHEQWEQAKTIADEAGVSLPRQKGPITELR